MQVSSIRGFIKYLHATMRIPPPIIKRRGYIPHIFPKVELIFNWQILCRIIKPADKDIQLKYPTMLRMLYGCGFRLGEVRNLKMGDIDRSLDSTAQKYKFNVERLVPMHPSLVLILKKYCCLRGI